MQICEAPAAPVTARRLSAEQFCHLLRGQLCSLYRPQSEAARMLTVGEAWGLYAQGRPLAAQLLLPLNADAAPAAALREYLHWDAVRHGCFLLPPIGEASPEMAAALPEAALRRAVRLARGGPVWAALECAEPAAAWAALYLRQGLLLRAVRPLNGLAPCFLFSLGRPGPSAETTWLPLDDLSRIALLLARGWAGVECRFSPQGALLGLRPPHTL